MAVISLLFLCEVLLLTVDIHLIVAGEKGPLVLYILVYIHCLVSGIVTIVTAKLLGLHVYLRYRHQTAYEYFTAKRTLEAPQPSISLKFEDKGDSPTAPL